jgi:hypothetical protein
MPSKTKTEITIHTRQTTVVRGLKVRCQQCGAEVSIMTAEHDAAALQTTPREIDSLINQGALHPVEETPSAKLICADSIAVDSETSTEVDG